MPLLKLKDFRGLKVLNCEGSATGLGSQTLTRIVFDGRGGAKTAERWKVGVRLRLRLRNVEQGRMGRCGCWKMLILGR